MLSHEQTWLLSPVPVLCASSEGALRSFGILCSRAAFRIPHISILTCHSLFYSVLGSPGGFGNTAGSCPTRLPLFQTTTVCISPGSPRSLSSILPGPYVCCELYKLYSVSETWGGDTLAWAQGLPTWDWQREEMGAGLSRLITFFSR